MRLLVDTFVSGQAKTKGSLTFKGGGYVEENVRGSKQWRRLMADACRRDYERRYGEPALATKRCEPIMVVATFWLALPPRLPTWIMALIEAGRAVAAMWERAGDVDKLSRNLLDALGSTDAEDAHIYADDNQVVSLSVVKLTTGMGALQSFPPGVRVTVLELDNEDVARLAMNGQGPT